MMRASRLRQRFRGAFLKQGCDRSPLGTHLIQLELVRPVASNDDEIHPGRKQLGPGPEALAAEPLHAVAPHCRAELAGDDDAQPRGARGRGLRRDEQREVRRADTPARPLGAHELRMLA